MRKAFMIAAIAAGAAVYLACATAFADDPDEKYRKYMKDYYKHLDEAREEADEGDWGDYRKEMRKADENFWKAQRYAPYGPGYGYDPGPRHFAPPPRYECWDDRYNNWGPRVYGGYGGYGGYRNDRFFLDLNLDF